VATVRERIARALTGGPLTLRALAIALGQRQHTVWTELDKMRDEGAVLCSRLHNNGRPSIQWRLPEGET
jgi:predicted ArsR family transcriptional regulator